MYKIAIFYILQGGKEEEWKYVGLYFRSSSICRQCILNSPNYNTETASTFQSFDSYLVCMFVPLQQIVRL